MAKERENRNKFEIIETESLFADRDRTDAFARRCDVEGIAIYTPIPFLSLVRFSQPTRLDQGMLQPSVCFIVQGRKKILIGEKIFYYGPGNYVATSFTVPIAGQVVEASIDKPYLGFRIDFEPKEITAMVLELNLSSSDKKIKSPAAYVGQADADLRDGVLRLLRLLDKPREISFLAPIIKQEILYRLLTAPEGIRLWRHTSNDRDDLAMSRVLEWMKKHFDQTLEIQSLAQLTHLSVSAFHRKFKAVTTLAPLQYQKRLRLLEARRLLLAGSVDAATAAFTVGYESPSQFSREYRRLFGAPPRGDVEQLKQMSGIALSL